MGNYRFRFSDMIPNAWFYKLRDMNKNKNPRTLNPSNKKHSSSSSLSSSSAKNPSEKPHLSEQRKSYHFTRDLTFQPIQKVVPDRQQSSPPRKSSRGRRSTKRNRRLPTPQHQRQVSSAGCSCRATLESVLVKPDPELSTENTSPSSSSDLDSVLTEFGSDPLSCSDSCKFNSKNDVVIDLIDESKSFDEIDNRLPPIVTKKNEFRAKNDVVINLIDNDNRLPSIVTKENKIEQTSTERNKYASLSVKLVKENFVNSAPSRRFSVTSSSPGVKLRTNSPRIANRKIQGRRSVSSNSSSGGSRRSVTESVAVVKTSKDPKRDFRESMMEMIVENNIRASKDLEELLACYLSLNSDEYHDIIVNVFKQIWFEFIHISLK